MKNEQVESWYAILQMQNFQGQTSNKKQTTTGLMGAGPDPAPTLSLDPPLYVLRLWGLASYNPQTLFAAKGLLSGNSLDGTPKERGNGHTTLKM